MGKKLKIALIAALTAFIYALTGFSVDVGGVCQKAGIGFCSPVTQEAAK